MGVHYLTFCMSPLACVWVMDELAYASARTQLQHTSSTRHCVIFDLVRISRSTEAAEEVGRSSECERRTDGDGDGGGRREVTSAGELQPLFEPASRTVQNLARNPPATRSRKRAWHADVARAYDRSQRSYC